MEESNILKNAKKLKGSIINSLEYQKYLAAMNKINTKEINKSLEEIKAKQKELANKEYIKLAVHKEKGELNILKNNLYNDPDYKEYLKRLNDLDELIKNITDSIEEVLNN